MRPAESVDRKGQDRARVIESQEFADALAQWMTGSLTEEVA